MLRPLKIFRTEFYFRTTAALELRAIRLPGVTGAVGAWNVRGLRGLYRGKRVLQELLIYGSGGFGREVAFLTASINRAGERWQLVAYADDEKGGRGESLHGIPLLTLHQAARTYPTARVALAAGAPSIREGMERRTREMHLEAATLIHPGVEVGPRVLIGEGTVICAGCTLTTDIVLGRQVQVNLHCTIGHDAVLEDFVTLAPGVHISGCVHIERSAYVGTNACVINGTPNRPIRIGARAVIGAGAVVTKDVPVGETWVGVPARRVQT